VTLGLARDNRRHQGFDKRIERNLQNRLKPAPPSTLAPSPRPDRRPRRSTQAAAVPGLRFIVRSVDSGHDALPSGTYTPSDISSHGGGSILGGGDFGGGGGY
jgi:hypothetical protein